ncbi:MarC family protein [Geminicoccaceae bacterium 1502E]|nr:MarC family protein [Geminicoccaceae bacterium 1502E]
MEGLVEAFATAMVAFLVTVDPLGIVPLFIAITRGSTPAARRRMAGKGVLIGGALLFGFALAGERLLGALGIGLPAFRIAGGLFLFLLALEMVFERRTGRRGDTASHLADERHGEDVAVFPLGIPLIAGPAAITSVILAMDRSSAVPLGELAVAAALLATLLATWLALLLAARLDRLLGPTLIGVLSRLLGLLLGALAVQYVLDGARAAFGL